MFVVFRMAIARLLACLPESDKLYTQKIKRMLLSLHHLNSTLFFESLPYLSSSDRRALKDAVGRSIPNYDRFEDQATNPRRYAKQNSEKVVVTAKVVSHHIPPPKSDAQQPPKQQVGLKKHQKQVPHKANGLGTNAQAMEKVGPRTRGAQKTSNVVSKGSSLPIPTPQTHTPRLAPTTPVSIMELKDGEGNNDEMVESVATEMQTRIVDMKEKAEDDVVVMDSVSLETGDQEPSSQSTSCQNPLEPPVMDTSDDTKNQDLIDVPPRSMTGDVAEHGADSMGCRPLDSHAKEEGIAYVEIVLDFPVTETLVSSDVSIIKDENDISVGDTVLEFGCSDQIRTETHCDFPPGKVMNEEETVALLVTVIFCTFNYSL